MEKMTQIKFRKISLTVVFFLIAAIVAQAADPPIHEMRKGDTLYSIAKKFSIPYEALAAANGITDPTKLKIGQRLVIPELYTVISGDSLGSIARAYGIATETLRTSNRLSAESIIQPGDVLIVPASRFKPAPPTTTTVAPKVPPSTTNTTTTTLKTTSTVKPVATTVTTVRAAPPTTTVTTVKATTTTTTVATTTTTTIAPKPLPAATTTSTIMIPAQSPLSGPTTDNAVPLIKTSSRHVDRRLSWPCPGEYLYLDGKLDGIMIRTIQGETAKAVAEGTVVSAGASRGFGQVAFVQSKAGYIYVYGGNEKLLVSVGEIVRSGQAVGRIGIDPKDSGPVAYFFIFRNGVSIDPATAPRD